MRPLASVTGLTIRCVETAVSFVTPQFIEDVWDIDYPAGGASVVEAVSGIVDMMKANGRDDARKIAFIIIDGETTHADGLEEVLGEAKDLDIDLFVVGTRTDADAIVIGGIP